MPNFRLTDSEADELAAFLLTASAKVEKKHPEFPKGDATKGAALAASLNCGSCHAGTAPFDTTTIPPLEAIFKKDWAAAGCVANKTPGKMPQMALTDDEKLALIAFSKKGIEPLQRNVPAESAAAQLKSLHCTNCHSIDGKASLLESVHTETKELTAHVKGENEKIDQSRPQLTYIGEMLHSSYIESMLAGTVKERPRPWLDMRMPGFPNFATGLSAGLARIHGVEPSKPEDVAPDKTLADIGKKLITKEDGFGCVTCHGVGASPPTAVFEVEGVNFALSHERLRHEYFTRWMENPPAITPPTKMPRYGDNTGKTQRTDVLDGDAAKQFEAIWNFIQKPN
jgi:mono/diheme cytochrome c family protein